MCLFHKEFDEIDPVSKWSIMFSLQLELAMRNEKMNPRERARMQLLEKISPVSQLGTVNDQMKIMKNEFKTLYGQLEQAHGHCLPSYHLKAFPCSISVAQR